MSFYSDASLVLVPSGIKDSKVYSIKPTDGSGDLTFTRNSNATRVNADGLVEKVRTNIALYSQDFSSGAWLVLNSTKVSTANTDPNGGSTACNVTWGAGGNKFLYQSLTQTGYYTVSMWVKSNGGGNNFRLFGDGTALNSADFTATTSWQRFSFTFNATGGSSWGIRNNSTQDAADLLVAFAQIEVSDFGPTQYIPTTSAAVSVGPVANLPRIDYTGGACGKLLLEPQTTALNSYSEQLDNAYWTPANCSVTANQTASPSGYVDAELILDNNSNQQHVIYKSIGITSGNKYTGSFFIKEAGYTTAAVRMGNGALWTGGGGPTVEFDLIALTGTVVDGSGVTYTIEDYGNGWRRCSVTGTCVTSGNTAFSLYLKQYSAYTGNGTSGVYAWGANITATSYVQSYIPTLSAAVTRGEDAAYKTGISSLIGQTEGTLYWEGYATPSGEYNSLMSVEVIGTRFFNLRLNPDNKIQASSSNFSSDFSMTSSFTATAGTYYKIAACYKSGDCVLYINGQQADTDSTTFTNGALTEFRANVYNVFARQKSTAQALLFKTRLTNAQLAELTAL